MSFTIYNPLFKHGFDNIGIPSASGSNNYLGTSSTNPLSPNQGEYYYNTNTDEFVYYDGVNWLSVDSKDYKFGVEGIPPAGNAFEHEGQLCTLSTSTGGVRGMVMPYNATIVAFQFKRALSGAANVIVELYKNNNQAAPIYTYSYTPVSPLSYYELVSIDVVAGDVIGIWNNSVGTGLIQNPYGSITIKRRY
jgi:hypothetical protein